MHTQRFPAAVFTETCVDGTRTLTLCMEMNPYTPPIHGPDTSAEEFLSGELAERLVLHAQCVKRGWTSRLIRLTGSVNAEIRYDGMGKGERVFVNDELVARTPLFSTNVFNCVTPRIDFHLRWFGYLLPATIDVYASAFRFLKITRFKLTVQDRVLYQE